MPLTQEKIDGLYELCDLKPKRVPLLLTGSLFCLLGSVCFWLDRGTGVIFGFEFKDYLLYAAIGFSLMAFITFSYLHAVIDRISEIELLLADY